MGPWLGTFRPQTSTLFGLCSFCYISDPCRGCSESRDNHALPLLGGVLCLCSVSYRRWCIGRFFWSSGQRYCCLCVRSCHFHRANSRTDYGVSLTIIHLQPQTNVFAVALSLKAIWAGGGLPGLRSLWPPLSDLLACSLFQSRPTAKSYKTGPRKFDMRLRIGPSTRRQMKFK
jgi:hypothetical protein